MRVFQKSLKPQSGDGAKGACSKNNADIKKVHLTGNSLIA
jgi:hypothetical protein